MKNNNIIFDLDGTLVDSKTEVLNTYKKVITEIAPTQKFDENLIDFGANLNTVLTSIYGTEIDKIAHAKTLFVTSYDNSNYNDTLLYDDVLTVLNYLKNKKHSLFIATNKRYKPTIKLLEAKNLKHFFTDIIGNEIVPEVSINKSKMLEILKTKHSITNGFMIGDTTGDIEAGNNNNLKTIAVTYGYETIEKLSKLNPDHIINNFKDITNFV